MIIDLIELYILPGIILLTLALLGFKTFRPMVVFCGFWLGYCMGSIHIPLFIGGAAQSGSLPVIIGIVTAIILGLMAIKLYKPVIFILMFYVSCIGLESVFAGSPLNDIVNLPVANYILIGITTALCSSIIACIVLKFFKPIYMLACSWCGMFVFIILSLGFFREEAGEEFLLAISMLLFTILTIIALVLSVVSNVKRFKSSSNVIGKFFKILSIIICILLMIVPLILLGLFFLIQINWTGIGDVIDTDSLFAVFTLITGLVISNWTAARQFRLYRDVKI